MISHENLLLYHKTARVGDRAKNTKNISPLTPTQWVLPDLTLILFECGESLILVDRTDIILIILNLISSSKSGGFDPEISIIILYSI